MDNESLDCGLEPQTTKRKRSSILKPPEKRVSRDSRTVSFNDRCVYKELHKDGTCDITNLFLHDDMDLTLMDYVEPANNPENQTINSSADMSTETASIVEQFMDSMPRVNSIEMASVEYDTSTIYDKKKMSLASDMSNNSYSSTHSSQSTRSSQSNRSTQSTHDRSTHSTQSSQSMMSDTSTLVGQQSTIAGHQSTIINCASDISSLNSLELPSETANETFYGAFHDSNNISIQSRPSGIDTLIHNVDALNDCIRKVDQESENCRQKLDEELEKLFKFYRHVVNKENKYEFAVKIFGLRNSLWLILTVDPDTYPHERLHLRFGVHKRDRALYPFAEYAEAVARCTKEGRDGYLTQFIINAQKFRRFLRYRRPSK